ncbi:hypothetical protein IEQ34_023104 [Dendrobium chrysotoxum]|uniref:F-box domain-containing protein n=1 Tax=Dendrobium chrysotoxum TaxID=161865 RepID=A0AAV7FZN2_DENCH|nr:hypothetical protein IEQ34_023104 [Dendrobium chrysotoxum]
MSSSWYDLPLDLLISIRNKLKSSDLVSFRSVCSQWHSASPIPNPCQPYIASFDNKSNITFLTLCHYNGTPREHFISLPFSLSSTLFDIHYSNGWLVFINYDNYTPYLFDAISNHKFTFPPLKPMILRYYKKIKPTVHVCFQKIVVSLSFDAGIAVAGIVKKRDQRNPTTLDCIFIFCKHTYGDYQRWSLLMKGSKGIRYIALAGNNRFYALGNDCELYMLDERPPLIRLRKIKLWLPKHFFGPNSDNSPPIKRLPIRSYGMKKSGETNLKVYAYYRISYMYSDAPFYVFIDNKY